MRRTLLIATVASAICFAPSARPAECWIVSSMKGQAQYQADGPKFINDGFGSRELTVIFDGAKSNAIDSELNFVQVGERSIVGAESGAGWSTIETWSVDAVSGRAYYTKAVSGSRAVRAANIDGVRAFVGDARRCN